MAGFEPAFSSPPSWRIARLSYILSEAVPAAGVEPAASAFSARRSHHLSYTGMSKRRRQESNLLRCRVAADRLAVRPRRHQGTRAGGGTRTHFVRITRAVPGLSSLAGLLLPVRMSSQLDRGSELAAGLEPARAPFQERHSTNRVAPAQEGGRRESNPHNPGSQPGLAAALSSATVLQPGIEPGTRPSQGRVMSLSPSKPRTIPRPGVEPGPAPSEGAMMSLSPPGQQPASDQGGT
jgi:hypothetical protein